MSEEHVRQKGRTPAAERIRAARETAAAEIEARVDPEVIPEHVAALLTKAWYNVLVLKILRHGPRSERYGEALGVADDLAWTAQPKVSAADVARLQSMLPQLGRNLRAGLEMVAFSEAEIGKVFEALKELYRSQIAERYREQLHMPSVRSSGPLSRDGQPRPSQLRPVQLDELPKANAGERRAGSYVRSQLEGLKPGAWLEFDGPDGERIRAKLSWVSPISKRYLFVTATGTKLADKTFDELAEEVARGETLLLEAAPIFKAMTPGSHDG